MRKAATGHRKKNSALQSQLAKYFAEEQQAETGGVYDKATVQQAEQVQNDMIRTADRGNVGEVLNQNPDGSYNAFFRNNETGEEGIHRVEAENAQRIAEPGTYEVATRAAARRRC